MGKIIYILLFALSSWSSKGFAGQCPNFTGSYVDKEGCAYHVSIKVTQTGCEMLSIVGDYPNFGTFTNNMIVDGQMRRYDYGDGKSYSLYVNAFTLQGLMSLWIYHDNRNQPPTINYWNLDSNGNLISQSDNDKPCTLLRQP